MLCHQECPFPYAFFGKRAELYFHFLVDSSPALFTFEDAADTHFLKVVKKPYRRRVASLQKSSLSAPVR
jgi:hypothetical protein